MQSVIFGGVSGIRYEGEDYDLGEGIIIRKVFAHLFSPYMMAFKPPGKYKHHDGPWKAAKGGSAFDILLEIEVPPIGFCKKYLSQEDILFIIGFLIKVSSYPYVSIPVISDVSFAAILGYDQEPVLQPYETRARIFQSPNKVAVVIDDETLSWVARVWKSVVLLIQKDLRLFHVFKAMESATLSGNKSSSMMLIWGAIEQLFSTNGGELKFRVAANLACFLKPPGSDRLKLFTELKKLYDQRSTAAHTVKEISDSSITYSFIHLRNAIIKIIEDDCIPTITDFEESLFLTVTKD